MIKFVEGKSVSFGEVVDVYYNLRVGGFSIKSRDKQNPNNGKVVGYADNVQLVNCTFKSSEATRNRILRIGHKEIYAVVRGILVGSDLLPEETVKEFNQGYCNPFCDVLGFHDWNTKEQLTKSDQVIFYNKYFAYKKGAN